MMKRRKFIKNSGLAAGGLLLSRQGVPGSMTILAWGAGGPLHNIPVDKGLDPAWIKGLYKRSGHTTYLKSRNELRYIGMPAGGLHSGTVYLGGDGRLWLWSIYSDVREGIDPKEVLWNDGQKERKILSRDGAAYLEPAIADNKRILEQGIALQFEYGGKTIVRELRENDWKEISFEATYPVATVTYTDPEIPFVVTLKGGPLFIPTNAGDSSLPATVLHVEITNKGTLPADVSFMGWLENGAGKLSAGGAGVKFNELFEGAGFTGVYYGFDGAGEPEGRDQGTMAIAILSGDGIVNTACKGWEAGVSGGFDGQQKQKTTADVADKLVGSVGRTMKILPGKTIGTSVMIAWHFNHPLKKLLNKLPDARDGYYYAKKFTNAAAVIEHAAGRFREWHSQTLLWQKVWYDSTLPEWLLERCIINIGTIATANTYRFASGRFWGWEGVNSCAGTCTHVWQYAQALGRLFPELERDTRERVDLGVAMKSDGGIIFRAEFESRPAIDGQAGTILRCYREHMMSGDRSFLERNWANIRKAIQFLLDQDKNGDGMTDTPMENTLDAVWDGEIAWIVGLSIAAVKAGWMMAEEMGDDSFAATCQRYVEAGGRNMAEHLYNGEYFIHRPDTVKGRAKLGSYNTCHIDQVYGQSWAYQVGLGELWDNAKTRQALRSLWKYNLTKDVGPYIATHYGGRPYALAGEGGMIMNTNPKNEPKPYGEEVTWQMGYFHECMSGFEHQVASHMMAEGMTDEALVLTRMIHDRYDGAKRNPYNEIECSDHYARAMASYGTYITACGFYYHGPNMEIGFDPAMAPEKFKAAFTVAKGWGSYEQAIGPGYFDAAYTLYYGELRLRSIRIAPLSGGSYQRVRIMKGGKEVAGSLTKDGKRWVLRLHDAVLLLPGEKLAIHLS
ncbi:MAG TPA: GH116 family glycosyl hydrolase [Puia sp.]|nr:GH116 family glycosyl hydrolase [Puia sp.]